MIITLLSWVIVLTASLPLGMLLVKLLEKLYSGETNNSWLNSIDGYFYAGLLFTGTVLGYLSLFIPLNGIILLIILSSSVTAVIIFHRELVLVVDNFIKELNALKRYEKILLILVFLIVLTSVATKITWGDSLAYHAQNIKWIRSYPVVPGLGNLHDRYAFNSMFFVLSAPYTFKLGDVVVFPLNGVSFIVLAFRLICEYSRSNSEGRKWEGLLYVLPLILGILLMLPNLNTPSPDIICGILIIYVFLIIIKINPGDDIASVSQLFVLILIILSLITFKLSSIFMVLAVFLYLKQTSFKVFISIVPVSIVIILPFLLRNYFLSGYLLYPFPQIDLFFPDWKIPYEHVKETKSVIEAWARIPVMSYNEVLSMRTIEWIKIWLSQLNFNYSAILFGNVLFIITIPLMLFKHEYRTAFVSSVILLNLVFWFVSAPDPRFAFGFILTGFALNAAFLVKFSLKIKWRSLNRYLNFLLIVLMILVFLRRIKLPAETISNSHLWVFPNKFGPADTRIVYGNFQYHTPVVGEDCFFSDIPCVSYLRDEVEMRSDNYRDGFRIANKND